MCTRVRAFDILVEFRCDVGLCAAAEEGRVQVDTVFEFFDEEHGRCGGLERVSVMGAKFCRDRRGRAEASRCCERATEEGEEI